VKTLLTFVLSLSAWTLIWRIFEPHPVVAGILAFLLGFFSHSIMRTLTD